MGVSTSILSWKITKNMVSFTDARMTAGIDFQHFNSTRRSLLSEDLGSGLAWGDYDNDGDYDLFLVNFRGSIRETGMAQPSLYRNDGDGTFTDVAPHTLVANPSGRSLGAIWFDFDLDGHLDFMLPTMFLTTASTTIRAMAPSQTFVPAYSGC